MYSYPMEKTELADHFIYSYGYIFYEGIEVAGIPNTLEVNGIELVKKDAFHITLIWTEKIAKIIYANNPEAIEKEIIAEVKDFLQTKAPRDFELTGEFRFCQEAGESTVIAMCNLFGAEKLFAELSKKYNMQLPVQPFHITIYKLEDKRGIGILSNEHLEKISKPVELPELKKIKAAKPE